MNANIGIRRIMIVAALMLSSGGTAFANPNVYQKVLRSAVFISAGKSLGSGSLIDADNRLVLTAYHVVDEGNTVTVYFPGGDENGELITHPLSYVRNFNALQATGLASKGHVVARWKEKDLALVQLDQLPESVEGMPLASASAQPGENIHVIGNSGANDGALWRYSHGTVRNVYVKEVLDFCRDICVLETDCTSNQGDSGGPVVNDNGELVGVVSHGERPRARVQNGQVAISGQTLISYEVDVREVHAFLQWFYGNNGESQSIAMAE